MTIRTAVWAAQYGNRPWRQCRSFMCEPMDVDGRPRPAGARRKGKARPNAKAVLMEISEAGFETATAPAPAVSDQDKLQRAKGYPYPRPDSSFVFVNGQTYDFDDNTWGGAGGLELLQTDTVQGQLSMAQVLKNHGAKWELSPGQKLTPVLAVGSNAAPVQLARKFPKSMFPDGVVIPVLRCVLPDFDVVYAPLISSYGSCTATLENSPGTAVALFVTYLQPHLLERMDQTEGAYNLCQLTEVQLQIGLGLEDFRRGQIGRQIISTVYQYNHQHGSLYFPIAGMPLPKGIPIALKEIKAVDRLFPALGQIEMQLACKHVLGALPSTSNGSGAAMIPPLQIPASQSAAAGGSADSDVSGRDSSQNGGHGQEPQLEWWQQRDDLDDWMLQNLNDGPRRLRMVEALVRMATPFRYPAFKLIKVLGDLNSENVS
ncbi:hypothetical protein ABBQ38_006059 [Trebouxia sp. C0009 RCD-2024]